MKKNMKQSRAESKTNKVTDCKRSNNVSNKSNNKVSDKTNNLGFESETKSFELDDNDDHSFELR